MREFKVSEIEKNKILQELNKQIKYYQQTIESELGESELDENEIEYINQEKIKLEQMKIEVKKVQEEGCITQRLIRLVDLDMDLELSEETQKQILEDMTSDTKDWLEDRVKSGNIEWGKLRAIYEGNSVLENEYIPLEPRVAEILLQMKKNSSVSWETEDRENKERIVEDIRKGKISYKDYNVLIRDLDTEDREENDRFIANAIYRYNTGSFSESELLKVIGSSSNKSLENYMQKYLKNKRDILENSVNKIYESSDKLAEYGEELNPEHQAKLDKLLATMNLSKINEVDDKFLESFVDSYNEIANDVWKEYLDGKDKFLIHVTDNGIEGEFKDAHISTSLISISSDLDQTYRGRKVGYQIKPKHISKADSQDVYIRNSRQDRYAASGVYRGIDIKLPQIVERETLEKSALDSDVISEIAVDDFEIESVVILEKGVPKKSINPSIISTLSYAENFSEMQNNIPIKVIGPNGLISLEEAQKLEDKRKFQEIVIGSSKRISVNTNSLVDYQKALMKKYEELGLKNNLTDFSEVKMISEKLIQDMEGVNPDIYSEEKSNAILENMENTDDVFRFLKSQEYEKYQNAVGEKVKSLIVNAKKASLENEKAHVESRKVGFVQRLFGGNRLKEAQLKNIDLREKLIKPEDKKYESFTEMTEALFECTKENGLTSEILDFVEKFPEIQGFESRKQMEMVKEIKKQPRINENTALEPTIGFTKISEEVNKVLARNIELEGKVRESRANNTGELCERLEKNSPLVKFKEIAGKTRAILELDNRENVEKNREKQNTTDEVEK